ncbi:MAG: 50S ribosomal protein L23 [Parcubacteria group bacterium GW2011_GWA2_44_13]|nr:MAG: 50S ribosomal protein L23 [Parcubacteria group bacterium GW2011_GWA2_44_13]
MPFTLGQMFGGWGKKGTGKKTPRARDISSETSLSPSRKKLGLNSATARPHLEVSSDLSRAQKAIKGESDLAWELITAPHISEKATMLGESKYIFKVSNKATKGTLRRAIEERYKVDVESLNILIMPAKKRRRGNVVGLKSGFKKAIVALKTGQTISEF